MIYLLIAIVLLVIVAPIVHVLPSKEQKVKMAKRREAMGVGVGVELVKIEDPDPDPKKYQTSTAKPLPRQLSVAAYRLHRGVDASLENPRVYKLMRYDARGRKQFTGQWYWPKDKSVAGDAAITSHLSECLDRLPSDVVQVEEKNNFVSVYWHESGDVTEVIDFLKRTAAIKPS
jgi:hypothetical protein